MNRTPRNRLLISLVWLVGLSGIAKSMSNGAPVLEPKITVWAFNFAQVSTETWSMAQNVAARIFNHTGIDMVWRDCSLSSEGTYAPDCERPQGATEIIVRLVPASAATRAQFGDGTLGIASQPEKGTPASASVFYDRVKELAKGGGASIEVILGHAVAHEIGHLLLGSNSHSSKGLMRARWSWQDLQQAAGGELQFTRSEVARIREGLLKCARQAESVSAENGVAAPSAHP